MTGIPADVLERHRDLVTAIDELVAKHGRQRRALIPILQDLRGEHRQISDVAMQVVADRLGITPVDVQGVVTFYHFLGTERAGRHTLHLCRTISCAMAGMQAIASRLERETGTTFGETTPDGAVTLRWVNCIGMCDQAPAILVDRVAHGRVTPDEACRLVEELRNGSAEPAANG
jgi:NADH:ubiquinone oxidoreductase subunit E